MNTEEEILKAYLEWISFRPFHHHISARFIRFTEKELGQEHTITFTEPAHMDGDCCFTSHFVRNAIGENIAKPDQDVCPRERAWRKYVRLRDAVQIH